MSSANPPLPKPELSAEDIRKLHAEVNQIINQSFTLNTAAITAFGVVLAWTIQKPGTSPDDAAKADSIAVVGAVLIQFVLFLLDVASSMMIRQLHLITSYLRVTAKSRWEMDWQEASRVRNGRLPTLGRVQALIFVTLAVVSTVWPGLLHYVYGRGGFLYRLLVPFCVGAALLGAAILLRRLLTAYAKDADVLWTEIARRSTPSTP
jgi:hypothetical protein